MAISQKMVEAIEKVFEEYGDKITAAAKDALAADKKNATKELSDSFNYKIVVNGEIVTLNILADDYLKYVENGRGPGGQPPINALVKWIQYKGFEPPEKSGTRHGIIESRGVRSNPGIRRGNPVIIRRNVKVSNERFAFAIAKNIMKRGLRGTPLLKPIISAVTDEISQKLLEAVKESIENDFNDLWKGDDSTDFLTYNINF